MKFKFQHSWITNYFENAAMIYLFIFCACMAKKKFFMMDLTENASEIPKSSSGDGDEISNHKPARLGTA